ncbi:MAG: hypothetical protein L6R41_004936 [Letrouitia leprolyta]|nr:MAG: hypothetical protein L6R41_004936 [Letrouitia leprolyta]
MGNFCSTPRQRLEYEVRFDQNDKELVRHTLRQIADHAEVSAQLGRRRLERRRQKVDDGYGSRGQHGSRQRQPARQNGPDEMNYFTAPQCQPYGPQGATPPRSPPHQGPQGLPPRAAGPYGNYPPYPPAAFDGEDDEEASRDDGSEGLGLPSRQYGSYQARALPKFAARGRPRQSPLARRPKDQEAPQDAAAAFMARASPPAQS